MFYEFNNIGRESWEFPFLGSELLTPATNCHKKFKSAEMSARNQLADLMRDPHVSQHDPRIADLKRQIEHNGKQAESCAVFMTCFEREPDRKFQLSLGDVVFFGLEKQ
jgi:hypothetical protein